MYALIISFSSELVIPVFEFQEFLIFSVFVFSITNYQVAVDDFRQIDCGSSLSFFPEGGPSSRPG